jgi:hypothetical protein
MFTSCYDIHILTTTLWKILRIHLDKVPQAVERAAKINNLFINNTVFSSAVKKLKTLEIKN